jgi:hypothetical protein
MTIATLGKTMCMSSIGLQLSPPIVLFWIYLFINLVFIFLPFYFSHFAHVDVLMCLTTTPVRISSLTQHVSSKLC